ncbi:uncharacterized protein METZ01_LOCUS419170 [marine metagenome]|uniref:Uncharacterized protein n=1 Tax=marine metagenome TaxID=408172 RepID=A0A382X576_9ZZZZ
MNIPFKPFASLLFGMCLIGFSIGFILGFYIHGQFQTYFYMYAAAPFLGLGSGLIIYGTLYGRNVN